MEVIYSARLSGVWLVLGGAVADYRLYCLDGANRFDRAENFEAPDDNEAVRRARSLMGAALKCEVWQRNRLVARIDRSADADDDND